MQNDLGTIFSYLLQHPIVLGFIIGLLYIGYMIFYSMGRQMMGTADEESAKMGDRGSNAIFVIAGVALFLYFLIENGVSFK